MDKQTPEVSVVAVYGFSPNADETNQTLNLLPGIVFGHIPVPFIFSDVSPENVDTSLGEEIVRADITVVGNRTEAQLRALEAAITEELNDWFVYDPRLAMLVFTVRVNQVATSAELPLTQGRFARTEAGKQIDPETVVADWWRLRWIP